MTGAGVAANPRAALGDGVARVFLGSLVAKLPLGMSAIALLLFARSSGYSFGVAGAALAAMGFCNAVAAPLQGAIIDRRGQVLLLAATAYGQGALLLLFALSPPADDAALFVVLAGAIGALQPPASACLRALLVATIAERARLERLFSLDAIGVEVVFALGPLLVAAAVAVASPAAAIGLMAALSVAGATVYLTSGLVRGWRPPAGERTPSRAGALAVPGLKVVLASVVLFGISAGACQVGLTALALAVGGSADAAVLLALLSVGSIAGGAVYFRTTWRTPPSGRYPPLLAAVAAGNALLLIPEALWLAAPLTALAGVCLTPAVACQNTLIGLLVPEGQRTEAFAWNTAGIFGGIAAGSGLGGFLVDAAGFRAALGLAALAAGLAAAAAWRWRGRLEPHLAAA